MRLDFNWSWYSYILIAKHYHIGSPHVLKPVNKRTVSSILVKGKHLELIERKPNPSQPCQIHALKFYFKNMDHIVMGFVALYSSYVGWKLL